MKELKIEAKTVKEAIEKGLKELNLTREQVEVEIVQEEKKGILGIGFQNACVIIREKNFNKADELDKTLNKKEIKIDGYESFNKTGDLLNDLKKILTDILRLSRIDAKITKELYDETRGYAYINIQSKDAGLLLYDGAKGLLTLQQIVSMIINRHYENKIVLRIDTEEFWNKAESKIRRDVEHAIEFIRKTKKTYKMKPMPSPFRKIIHDIVKNNYPDYSTFSIGSGRFRRVVIKFKEENKEAQNQTDNTTNQTYLNENPEKHQEEKQENVPNE
ncbi:MAG: Jag N-terminal domain-containing protein [Elusimicrobiales bacterium]